MVISGTVNGEVKVVRLRMPLKTSRRGNARLGESRVRLLLSTRCGWGNGLCGDFQVNLARCA